MEIQAILKCLSRLVTALESEVGTLRAEKKTQTHDKGDHCSMLCICRYRIQHYYVPQRKGSWTMEGPISDFGQEPEAMGCSEK